MRNLLIALVISIACCFMVSCGLNKNKSVEESASSRVAYPDDPYESCSIAGLSLPDKQDCIDRVKNCYQSRNSQSLVCRRKLIDLFKDIKPAELVEIEGVLKRREGVMYLVEQEDKQERGVVRIVGDSCMGGGSETICSVSEDSMVTLIGAFYSAKNPPVLGGQVAGNMLVLDFIVGDRGIPPAVE